MQHTQNIEQIEMETLVKDICQAITDNQLNLPPLPETCLRVRALLQDENCSAKQLANTIASDTALAARIMKVANSALYARHMAADDLQMAIQRLGNSLIGSLVNGLAIMPVFSFSQGQQQEIEHQIKQHSMSTAALAYGLCQQHKSLNKFEGYLAAMLQNIGCVAVLSYHKLPTELLANKTTLTNFLNKHHISIGGHLLRHWQFPETLIEIQQKHANLFRNHSSRIDYLDIVITANVINGLVLNSDSNAIPNYGHIPAMQRLNITETSLNHNMLEIQPSIQEARFIFQAAP